MIRQAEINIEHGDEKYRAILWREKKGGIIKARPRRTIDGATYPADEVFILMNADANDVLGDLKSFGVDIVPLQPLVDAIMKDTA